jgi:hypothetical protein
VRRLRRIEPGPQGHAHAAKLGAPRYHGSEGFWGRWLEYAATGHGGYVRLMSRDPSDYQVTILEVAGSAASHRDMTDMESNWKLKLLSRRMGLNAH